MQLVNVTFDIQQSYKRYKKQQIFNQMWTESPINLKGIIWYIGQKHFLAQRKIKLKATVSSLLS